MLAQQAYQSLNAPLKFRTNGVYYKMSYRGFSNVKTDPFSKCEVYTFTLRADRAVMDVINNYTNPIFREVFGLK